MSRLPNRKTKIFRLIARLNTGGPARHVVWLTAGLPPEEFEGVLLCGTVPPGEGDMSYFAAENAVEPLIIPEMSRELSPKDVISLWKVYRQLRRVKPDIIHTHTAKAGTLGRVAGFCYRWLTPGALVGRPRRVFFVHTYHGHVFHSYYGRAKTLFFLTIERVLARLATHRVLVLSEQQRREIHEDFKVGAAHQFHIVPLGIDLQVFQNPHERRNILRAELKANEDEILIGIVGRLTEVKNHSLFLRVTKLWRERESENPQRIRFVIIGDGHLREQLETEARELSLTEKELVFVGERRDPHVFYPALDVTALTSHNEGTPLTLIEAMANALPVISTAVGGVVDLLGAKEKSGGGFEICERGVAIEPNNPESFYAGLKQIVENKRLRDKLSKRGAEFVAQNYSKERLISDVASIYRELLSR